MRIKETLMLVVVCGFALGGCQSSRERAGLYLADPTAVQPQFEMLINAGAELALVVDCIDAEQGQVNELFEPEHCINTDNASHKAVERGEPLPRRQARHYAVEYMSVVDEHCQAHFRGLGIRNTGVRTGAALVTTGAGLTATLLQNANSASIAAGIATVASTFATKGGGAIDTLNASYAQASHQNVNLRQRPIRDRLLSELHGEVSTPQTSDAAGGPTELEGGNGETAEAGQDEGSAQQVAEANAGERQAGQSSSESNMDDKVETVGLAADLRAYRRQCHVPVAGTSTSSEPLFTIQPAQETTNQ